MKPAKPMDSKKTLQEEAKARLNELKTQIEEIQAKSRNEAILDDLRQKQEKAEEQIRVFESASGESWRVFIADMEDAISTLKNAVDEAASKIG